MNENQVLVKICATPKTILHEWLPLLCPFINVNKIFTRQYVLSSDYDENSFLFTSLRKYTYSELNKTIRQVETQNFFFELTGEDYISIVRFNNEAILSILLSEENYLSLEKQIVTAIENGMQKKVIQVAYIAPYDEFLFQYDYHPASNIYRHIQQKKYNAKDITLESLEQNFFDDDIWKPLYWRMWFNNYYSQMVVDNYNQLSSQIYIVSSEYVYVELYNDLSLYNTQEAILAKQLFERCIYANNLSNESTVEINYKENILTITHYLNDSNELVTKSNATYLEVFKYILFQNTKAHLLRHQYYAKENFN